MFEFHISRQSRDRYRFEEALFSITGNVILADFSMARRLAERMNRLRGAAESSEPPVTASDIYAMGLIDEILHYMVELYRRTVKPAVMADAYSHAQEEAGGVEETLGVFTEHFPPVAVYQGRIPPAAYLSGTTAGTRNRHISLEEMIMLFLANENPAFMRFLELFDDAPLEELTRYPQIMESLDAFFASQPGFGPGGQSLLDLLRAPAKASPDSLYGQLEYIRTSWGHLLEDLLLRILKGMDFYSEEHRARFFGPGPSLVPRFGPGEHEEIERFSPDLDWMPHLVLIAKSTHVWLFQLSRKYGRSISRLDEIPDGELEQLSRWGITGLWLIGVWERSPASRRIKQLTGNPEAAASAYSVYDYTIAWDLGGRQAYESLKQRAMHYGIRLATDMVPNHTGIYSKWVIEHPDWFIQLGHSPFPSYRFSGENLSEDDRVEVQIEDGYWSRTDAAVVFRRHDRHTGETRYIYHGNDGTSTPWNDTAQLDFLKAEVRDAVIRKTIEVAKDFPVIRFDAAMTLAKRHFQRLWYPLPGYGGDIPSRSAHSVSQEDFDALFPQEFWRELVDRVAAEAPDTLLLAEAFWLMEGYFVRSLGMHRVYNSAFMNMLKSEENSKYRDVMKNVLRFNPEILRRFVNFMNNPDEEPAVAQFGKGDKYFGVATLMVTLPGLPMFGHGQIEGYSEKYGMEYRRSYWDEGVDGHLVARHEREIFPLLRKRYLFSDAEHFTLFDVASEDGHVNEDVFAYSNMAGDERALVVYNNRYAEARGWVRRSVGMALDTGDGRRRLVHKSLGEALRLSSDENMYYVLEDFREGLQYLRSGRALCAEGLLVNLGAFKSNVFMGFREVRDVDGEVRRLFEDLSGRGVPDVMSELRELSLRQILGPFRSVLGRSLLSRVVKKGLAAGTVPEPLLEGLAAFFRQVREHLAPESDEAVIVDTAEAVHSILASAFGIRRLEPGARSALRPALGYLLEQVPPALPEDLSWWRILLMWSMTARTGALVHDENIPGTSRAMMDELLLGKALRESLVSLGLDEAGARYELLLVQTLVTWQEFYERCDEGGLAQAMEELFADPDAQALMQVNQFGGRLWFNKECFEQLMHWLFTVTAIRSTAVTRKGVRVDEHRVLKGFRDAAAAVEAAGDAGYEVGEFLSSLREGTDA